MANRIIVSTAHLDRVARDLDTLQDAISEAAGILAGVNTSKDCGGDLRVRVSGSLFSGGTAAEVTQSLTSAMRKSGSQAGTLASGVRKSAQTFADAEDDLYRDFSARAKGKGDPVYGNGGAGEGSGGGGGGAWSDADGIGGAVKVGAQFVADWLGYEFADDHPGITAWLGRASAEARNAWGHAGVNAYLGKVDANAKLDGSFMQMTKKKKYVNGEWTETESFDILSAEASAGITASLFSADVNAGVGTDMLGLEGSAEVAYGKGTLEAKGEFSIGEDGFNAVASGKAMVAAAEGKASASFNILGIEIKGTIGGYAGAAGVEGKIGFEDNKFVMEGGVAALFGISGGIEIGFNDEGWSNFVDFVTFWD